MKRKYFIRMVVISIAILFIHSGQAQEIFTTESAIGMKQGVNISRVFFDPIIDQKMTNGYSGGIIFKYISERSLGIQMELNLLQQGWTEKLDTTDSYFRRINQINFPFMTHIELGKDKTKFLINFGPSLSYLVSEKEKIKLIDPKDAHVYYGKKLIIHLNLGSALV